MFCHPLLRLLADTAAEATARLQQQSRLGSEQLDHLVAVGGRQLAGGVAADVGGGLWKW